jgi:hypothetical protein
MAASCCTCMAWGNRSSTCVASGARALGLRCASGPTHQSEPDLSCEAETCHGDPFSGELVGNAANWPKTGRLASVGLD